MQKSANQLETGTFSAPDKSPNNPAPGRRFDNKFFATMQTFDFRNIAMTSTPRSTAPALKQAIAAAVFALIASLILWTNQQHVSRFFMLSPLLVHTLLETITITIFVSVFIVCWNAFGGYRSRSSVVLAVTFLSAAILGFVHAISFQGMPEFTGPSDMHKSFSAWIASRAIIALTLLGLSMNPKDPNLSQRQSDAFLMTGLVLTAVICGIIFMFPHAVPLMYTDQYRQTNFKIACEVVLVLINLISAALFLKHSLKGLDQQVEDRLEIARVPLFLASWLMGISEVYFSLYAERSDVNVAIGHFLQLAAAIAIYRSMVAINIHKPYTRLATQTIEIARSAAELAAQRERLHRMIDTAIDGIITVDEHQTILMINPAAATIFGYDAEYLMGKSLTLLIPERHRAGHGSHLKKFGETGSTRRKMGSHYEDFYITGRRADGTEFPMEASIAHQLENGARIYTVIFRDITDRKIAKEKMAQYHEELSQLSAALQSIREEERKHIARELHDDLGQLLAALRMDLTLVQRAPELAAKSQSAIQSMDQLILTAITTLRRIATDLRPRALDEGGLFFALQTLQREFSQRHMIDCELIADEDQLTLDDARSTAIFRIVQESLTNVARHAEASAVTIEFEHFPDKIVFSICDNGKGIDEEDMRKSRSFGLVGMRERVKAMHGHFHVSGNAGEGTCLHVELPFSRQTSGQTA